MMNKYLLDDRSGTAGKAWHMSPPSHLRAAAVAAAIVLGALASLEAQALSLGRVTVLSALGEPLRAEIEIPQITAEEAEKRWHIVKKRMEKINRRGGVSAAMNMTGTTVFVPVDISQEDWAQICHDLCV